MRLLITKKKVKKKKEINNEYHIFANMQFQSSQSINQFVISSSFSSSSSSIY